MPDARFSEDFWTDPKIRKLDHDTQRLFIYLFTNPHRNYCGLYYLPKSFMREQTGLSDRAIDRGIDTLVDGGLIEYSDPYQMVFVKSMLKRQAPGYINAKQIKGIENHLNRLHRCPLIKSFLELYNSLNIKVSYTPINTPMDVQSQSQSQSKDKEIPQKPVKMKKLHPTLIPEDFKISDRVRAWAKKNSYNHLEEHLEAFILRAHAKGYKNIDWDAAFMGAIRENWGKIDLTKPETTSTHQRRPCPCGSGMWEDKCTCKGGINDHPARTA